MKLNISKNSNSNNNNNKINFKIIIMNKLNNIIKNLKAMTMKLKTLNRKNSIMIYKLKITVIATAALIAVVVKKQ